MQVTFICLKMLGLYLYTLIIGHKSCNMLSILNKLTLQKKLQTFEINDVFLNKTSKNTTIKNKKIKHKKPCRSRGLNPGPLAPIADALPLHHQSTESIDCSQAILLFRRKRSTHKKNKAKFAGQTFSTNILFL